MELHVRVVPHGFFRVLVREFLGCRDNGAVNDTCVECIPEEGCNNTAVLGVLENLLVGASCRERMFCIYRVLLPFQSPSLECRHDGLVDRLIVLDNIEVEPAPRALVVARAALDAQVALALGLAVFVGNCIYRAG